MKYKKTSTIIGMLILVYFGIGIYGLNAFKIYDDGALLKNISISFLIIMSVFSILYSLLTILNEENIRNVSTYFVSILFSLVVMNFIFWGHLGSILVLNDLLRKDDYAHRIQGSFIDVYMKEGKGEHYEAKVLIAGDTATFSIDEKTFIAFQGKKHFQEEMKSGYYGIIYK